MSSIAIVGSVNLDLVAKVKKLPAPGETVTDEGLDQCISDIRKAIGDSEQTLLTTHAGKGYSLAVRQDKRGGHIWPVLGVAVFIVIAFSGVALLWMAGALTRAN